MSIFRRILMAGIIDLPESQIFRYKADSKITPYYRNPFNGKIIYHKYNPETGEGEIGNSEEIVTIISYGFMNSNIKEAYIPNSVTTIEYKAFYAETLNKIFLPSNLEHLSSVFVDNRHSVEIHLSDIDKWCNVEISLIDYYAFNNCIFYHNGEKIINLILSENVTEIKPGVFAGYTELQSINLTNVNTIRSYAFAGCSNLTNVSLGENISNIEANAFHLCDSLPVENNICYADTYLIKVLDKSLETYIIKDGTKFIGHKAFQDCTKLKQINIPNSVKIIYDSSFENCDIININIPNSVIEISNYAFGSNDNLEFIHIGSGVKKISSTSFYYSKNLYSIEVSENNNVYDSRDNCNSIIETSTNTLILGSGNSIITNSIKTIEEYAFYGLQTLKTLSFGNSVECINEKAFSQCYNIESITLNEGLQTIGVEAFSYCNKIKEITIPSSVTSLGNLIFSGCSNLKKIICNSKIAPNKYPDTFINLPEYGELYCYNSDTYDVWMNESSKVFGNNTWVMIKEEMPELSLDNYDIAAIIIRRVGETSKIYGNKDNINGINIDGETIDISTDYTINDYGIPHVIKYKLKDNSKTGSSLFSSCDALMDFCLSDSIKTISENTFYNCRYLKTTHITNNIENIERRAFGVCVGINEDLMLNNITYIDDQVFDGCININNITLSDDLTYIGQAAFRGTNITNLILPYNIQKIDTYAFKDCKKLTNVELLCENADLTAAIFNGCESLPEQDGIKYVGDLLVEVNTGRYNTPDSINIKEGTKWIGGEAFRNYTKSNYKLTLPDSVISIGDNVFNSYLNNITMGDNVRKLGVGALAGTSIRYISLSKNITELPNNLFNHCENLSTITIPENVDTIGEYVFHSCPLRRLVIPNKVKYLNTPIRECEEMEEIVLGSGLERIESLLFVFQDKVTKITCKATTAPQIDNNTFRDAAKNGTLYYPEGSDYSSWLSSEYSYLGYHGWTGVETEF